MSRPKIIVIGGGLAGLSTGCYALTSGWDVTVVEHNSALGGVCTAWRRGPYTIDGCIHWLTGGPFSRIYEELRIVPPVEVRTLTQFSTIRSARGGWSVAIGPDLAELAADLRSLAPEDGAEIDRIVAAAARISEFSPHIERPPELATMREQLRSLWDLRGSVGALVHFRGSVGEWTRERVSSPALREVLTHIAPPEAPMLFVLMILGYLARGWLSRPIGGTARFRDALIDRFFALGGMAQLDSTVVEIVVKDGQARGVHLADGTILAADRIVSTASAPETVLHLLGGRHGGEELHDRLRRWKLFDPIVLASWGVARAMPEVPSTLLVTGIEATELAGRTVEHLYARVYNDDPSFAPPGHTVVQMMLVTHYDWWATRGSDYVAAKAEVADRARDLLIPYIPALAGEVRMTDVATPLTFWRHARAWHGAFEGWMPSSDNLTRHVAKTLPGLGGLYLAGQWVEPGGGVPTALMSGRQVVQLLCHEAGKPFVAVP